MRPTHDTFARNQSDPSRIAAVVAIVTEHQVVPDWNFLWQKLHSNDPDAAERRIAESDRNAGALHTAYILVIPRPDT